MWRARRGNRRPLHTEGLRGTRPGHAAPWWDAARLGPQGTRGHRRARRGRNGLGQHPGAVSVAPSSLFKLPPLPPLVQNVILWAKGCLGGGGGWRRGCSLGRCRGCRLSGGRALAGLRGEGHGEGREAIGADGERGTAGIARAEGGGGGGGLAASQQLGGSPLEAQRLQVQQG